MLSGRFTKSVPRVPRALRGSRSRLFGLTGQPTLLDGHPACASPSSTRAGPRSSDGPASSSRTAATSQEDVQTDSSPESEPDRLRSAWDSMANSVVSSRTLLGKGLGSEPKDVPAVEVPDESDSGESLLELARHSPLSAAQMDRAARIAALNSYVYTVSDEELEGKLQAAGLSLLTVHRNQFTRWFVAEGRLPHVVNKNGSASWDDSIDLQPNGEDSDQQQGASIETVNGESVELAIKKESSQQAAVERFVFVRGVVWRDPGVNLRLLWQELANCWPKPFAESHIGSSEVVVHRGVHKIATGVWESLLPSIIHLPQGMKLTIAGHSMGGALALVLTAKARIKLRLPREDLSCYAFGAPAVMAHQHGLGSAKVMRLLGLNPDTIKCFCLDDDPVPRAMLSVDPAYSMLRESEFGARILGLHQALMGGSSGIFTPKRFLFEPIGQHFLLRWDPHMGTRIMELGDGEKLVNLEEAMRLRVDLMVTEPLKIMKALTDHNQSAYVSELTMAALELSRAEEEEEALRHSQDDGKTG